MSSCTYLIATSTTDAAAAAFLYGHYIGQLTLASTPSEELEHFVEQSFTARNPLLMATSAFVLGRRRQSSPQWFRALSLYCHAHHVKISPKVRTKPQHFANFSAELHESQKTTLICYCSFIL